MMQKQKTQPKSILTLQKEVESSHLLEDPAKKSLQRILENINAFSGTDMDSFAKFLENPSQPTRAHLLLAFTKVAIAKATSQENATKLQHEYS